MEQQNNLHLTGLLRDEKTCLGNYRRRAHWIAVIQLTLSIIYLVMALFQFLLLSEISSSFKATYVRTYFNETNNQTLGTLTVTVQNPALDAAFSKLNFWMSLNAVRATLHILSSILLIWATREGTAKLRAIRMCYCSRVMNLAFFVYELVVFVFMFQEWEFVIYFTLYRCWFEYEVHQFINSVLKLAPPPPGHHC